MPKPPTAESSRWSLEMELKAAAIPILSSGRFHAVPFMDVPNDRLASMSVNAVISLLPLFQLHRANIPMSSVMACSALRTYPYLIRLVRVCSIASVASRPGSASVKSTASR